MGLFKADLFRSLAIGFALGAVAVFTMLSNQSGGVASAVVPQALAAPSQTGNP